MTLKELIPGRKTPDHEFVMRFNEIIRYLNLNPIGGSGDVSKVGTPVNNQIGVWTGDGTIEGDANLTFDTTSDTLTTVNIAASGTVGGSNLSGTNTGDQTTIVGITGTKAQFDTAVTDGNFLYVGDVTQYTDGMADLRAAAAVATHELAADPHPQYLTSTEGNATYQPLDAFLTDIASLTDPGADRIMFWDDSAGDIVWLELGSGLSISGTTITASGSSPTVIRKAANQTVSSASLTNDDTFTFAMAASTKYAGRIILYVDHIATSDFQFDITGPASPTPVSIFGMSHGATTISSEAPATAFSTAIQFTVAAALNRIVIDFYISNGVNSGTFQLRWANRSGTSSNDVIAGSYMTYQVVN